MKRTTRTTASPMRRIDYVRLIVDDVGTRAEVVGVGFRLPSTCPVPLSYAAELISGGTPSVTRHLRSGAPFMAEGG
jgi:hypothetical protein